MSVQLFLSEIFVTLALFVLGVVGYLLSKHGKTWLFGHRFEQLSKTKLAENKVDSEDLSPSQAFTKKVSTQSKNAEARRRAKREARSKPSENDIVEVLNARANDELAEMAEFEYPKRANAFVGTAKSVGVPETPNVQNSNIVHAITEAVIKDDAEARIQAEADAEVYLALNEEQSEHTLEMISATDVLKAEEVVNEESLMEQQSPSPESTVSTCLVEETEEEDTTSPETNDEAKLSEQLQQDSHQGVNHEIVQADEPCSDAAIEEEDDAKQCDPDTVPSEFDGSDNGLPDFNIPSTPPYGDDDMLMPSYMMEGVGQFQDTPTSAQTFTDGQQVFEPFYEPTLSPTGQQLYTDGEQVFMLACVEVPPEPNTPCAATHGCADHYGMLSNYPDGGHAYGCVSHSYGDDGEEVDDMWNVPWEDFMPEVFEVPVESWLPDTPREPTACC